MVKKTELYDRHVSLGARMIEFAGWLLPVQYPTGPKEEHHRVRNVAGLFDIAHMGRIVVRGRDALPFLQWIMTADVDSFSMGSANYSLMCYEDGGVIDDVFIYHLPDRYFLAVNAANSAKDTRWMQYHHDGLDVSVENISDETYMLALQGPKAEEILNPLCACDLTELAFHTGIETEVVGVPALVGRTGYTGEDGFELYFSASEAGLIWDSIMESGQPKGLLPIGLAARDSLRFEPCLPLYGQELTATGNPLEAGLGWAVAMDKPGFIGREALLKVRLEGARRKLVAFKMTDPGVPRHGYKVVVDGEV
ncbi:MAG: glycine cleavage system aminomethyltransferase GcvT, partial [Chloroflexi bacterium]|nr:glycine cleavage system aminomethyltransferase GcvT [Chloroflexota bacterium]